MPAFYTRLIALILMIFFLAIIPVLAAGDNAGQQIAERANYPYLTKEQPIERELKPGEAHRYRIKAGAEQYLHLSAEQHGIDIGLRLSTPAGEDFDEVDSYNSKKDGESFITILNEDGEYLLTVRSVDRKAVPGKYLLKIDELRAATEQDRFLMSARALYADADALYTKKTGLDFKNAGEKYQEALGLYRKAGDIKGEAESLRGLGNVYTSLNEPQKALPYYEQSLPLWTKLNDKYGQASTLLGIGDIYGALSEQEKALGYYEKALPIWVEKNDKYGQAYTLNIIGMIYRVIGDYDRAIGYFREAITPYQDIGNLVGEANTHDNMGGAYFSMEYFDSALYQYEQSLMLYQLSKVRKSEAITLANMGLASAALNKRAEALEYYAQALQIFRDELHERSSEASTLIGIGGVYRTADNTVKALEYHEQALKIFRELKEPNGEAAALSNIGLTYLTAKEPAKALENFSQALKILESLNYRSAVSSMHYGIAKAKHDLGDLVEARARIEEALKVAEPSSPLNIGQPRSFNFVSLREYYGLLIDTLMQLHKKDVNARLDLTALKVSEQARGQLLLELLQQSRAKVDRGIDEKLLNQERDLRQKILIKNRFQLKLLELPGNDAALTKINSDLNELIDQYRKLQLEIAKQAPRYAQLTQPATIDLKQAQAQLDDNSLILEYSLEEDHSYLWLIGKNKINSYELAPRSEIVVAAQKFAQLIGERKAAKDNDYYDAAITLSKLLLTPVLDQIGDKRLIFITDGALQFIPFNALYRPGAVTDANGSQWQKTATKMLLQTNESINLPSITSLMMIDKESHHKDGPQLAIIGDPIYSLDDARIKPASEKRLEVPDKLQRRAFAAFAEAGEECELPDDGGYGFARINTAQSETKRISALLPAGQVKSYLDHNANRALFSNGELKNYRMLHIAAYGLIAGRRGKLTGLALSMSDERGQARDGYLKFHELYNQELPELIVLSHCQTRFTEKVDNSGINGLINGFIYAGAARVVTSNWNVDDDATAALLSSFYQQMLSDKKLSPAAALRAAQLELLKKSEWSAPYYWAGFQISGKW